MKHTLLLFTGLTMMTLVACQKNDDQQASVDNTTVQNSALKGGGGGGGGGGGTTGILQGVLSGSASRLISGSTDSILVTFTQAVPPGTTLNIASSNPAVSVPSTFTVPVGAYSVYIPVTANNITNAINVIVTVTLGSQSKSTTLKVFPLTATFPAPQLQSPGNGSKFGLQLQVTFDWNDNNNAYYYQFQVSTTTAFTTLLYDILLNNSIYPTNWFDGTGVRYWRVRFVDAGGNGGPWSAVGNFEIKP